MAGANLISRYYTDRRLIHEAWFLMDEWYFLTKEQLSAD
jgi:hypothetical protein